MGVATCLLFGVFPLTDIEELRLPLSGFYPYKEQLFPVLYVYQIIGQIIVALCSISLDCIFACLLDHMCNQMAMLSSNLKSMRRLCEEKLRKQLHDDKIEFGKELQKLFDDMLIECVTHYTEILR
ncbi:hypothetical protein Trydic_g23612 [Trypoxylus dichotomus]